MRADSIKSDPAHLLLRWYDSNIRQFPWRKTNNPYKIWLSEVMLQQTQVKTVVPYYNRWVSKFPTIQSVAEAPSDSILKTWEGLGYYARARNFHSACKIIMNKHNGKVPDSTRLLLSLPGIGEYISGAIMSIAFNQSVAAIDSNAIRVISRLNSINGPLQIRNQKIARVLSKLICPLRPGDFNQAIMDLGREICTSKNPSCSACPISSHCRSFVNSVVDKYPETILSNKKSHYSVAAGIIWNKKSILVTKRKEKGLLGGLWEFPGGKIRRGETATKCIVREVKEELGIIVKPRDFLKQINHTYSHFSITMHCYHCREKEKKISDQRSSNWITVNEIPKYSFPKANHKIFNFMNKNDWNI